MYDIIAMLGPHKGADPTDVREALELLDVQQGFSRLLILDQAGPIKDVCQDYAARANKGLAAVTLDHNGQGNLAHISSIWELLERYKPQLYVFIGPLDPQVHNALGLVRHKNAAHWIPWPL